MKMTDETILSTSPEPADARVGEIGMQDVRLVAGEGKLSAHSVLQAVNVILRRRASLSPQVGEGAEGFRSKLYKLAAHFVDLDSHDGDPMDLIPWTFERDLRAMLAASPSPALPVRGEEIGTTTSSLPGSLTTGDQRGEIVSWQPIETAPRDDKQVLLAIKPNEDAFLFQCGVWLPTTRNWALSVVGDDVHVLSENRVSHWMPLPRPPSNGSNDDRAGVGTGHSPIVKQSSSVPCAANVLPQEGS